MSTKKEPLKLMVTIAERHQGSVLADFYTRQGVFWHYQCCGFGTASSDLLDVLGFGSPERDILISLGSGTCIDRLLFDINTDLRTQIETKGILFNIPLTGINHLVASVIYNQEGTCTKELEKGANTMTTYGESHSLILVAVNQGHTDDVMDTAKKAGARGGTIIKARWLGTEESQHFFGFTLQNEKEVVIIVVPAQNRNLIMDEINKAHGIHSQAQGMICSVGVDQVVRLT
jgi:hypothetical protein